MMKHKLVIDPAVIENDYRTAMKYEQAVRQSKMLIYQLTRITTERGCLKHDDRLDALAMAVGYFTDQMARDEDMGVNMIKEEALDRELELFMQNSRDPLGRSQGPRDDSWVSRYTSVS